jgi:hypothetical protein
LALIAIGALIAGVLFYVKKLRDDMRNSAVDDDPNSIIGSNPEPKLASKYGMQK